MMMMMPTTSKRRSTASSLVQCSGEMKQITAQKLLHHNKIEMKINQYWKFEAYQIGSGHIINEMAQTSSKISRFQISDFRSQKKRSRFTRVLDRVSRCSLSLSLFNKTPKKKNRFFFNLGQLGSQGWAWESGLVWASYQLWWNGLNV